MIERLFSKQHKRGNAGFTLVELLVSMTLTAIFATAVIAIMPSATKIYMQIQDTSRAQIVADMIVDALREECADSYIEDYASVKIIQAGDSADGDKDFLKIFETAPLQCDTSGNVLVVRKSSGYCEAIYTCMNISQSNYQSVYDIDRMNGTFRNENGISSRAVYRFFRSQNGGITPSDETLQGYVHYGFYQCGKTPKTFSDSDSPAYGPVTVSCIFPASRYDYTNPFTNDSYNGYTVKLLFSDLSYTVASDETEVSGYTQRPASVKVTVEVYKSSYSEQSPHTLVYTRTALLLFAEDTTR